MKLIKPSYEIMTKFSGIDVLKHIEKAGRTCYKAEDKIKEGSASDFARFIIGRGHESVIEHFNITVKFIIDRGVSHELVRHRLASFSQESTRYCNYSKDKFGGHLTFILPPWILNDYIVPGNYGRIPDYWHTPFTSDMIWFSSMLEHEQQYLALIDKKWPPQQARSVLPNALKTEIVVTANLREWRHIFKLRTSSKAHPQIREVMLPLQKELQSELPEIFET